MSAELLQRRAGSRSAKASRKRRLTLWVLITLLGICSGIAVVCTVSALYGKKVVVVDTAKRLRSLEIAPEGRVKCYWGASAPMQRESVTLVMQRTPDGTSKLYDLETGEEVIFRGSDDVPLVMTVMKTTYSRWLRTTFLIVRCTEAT